MRIPTLASRTRILAVLMSFGLTALAVTASHATETENQVLRILPASGKVVVDGKIDDWDLSGGIFACGDVERLHEHYGLWFHAMYDAENVYLLARWLDPTPLNNPQSSKGGQGWDGDCLQVRFITGCKTPHEVITWLNCWRDRDGISIVGRESPGERDSAGHPCVRLPKLTNALAHGVQQAFKVNDDGKGYVQEIAVPWKMLTEDGNAARARLGVAGHAGSELHDRFRRPAEHQGPVSGGRRSEPRVHLPLLRRVGHRHLGEDRPRDAAAAAVGRRTGTARHAGRRCAGGRLASLVTVRRLPGFKAIRFNMPFDGHVSLNLRDKQGVVVRQLLTDHPFARGTHEVKWDGLPTPNFRTPGQPLPAGAYTWEAIAHPGFKLTLRGWAAQAGIPWETGPGTAWGGDHGPPSACTADAEKVYLGWAEAEAGKGVVAVDLDGKVVWTIGRGTGGAVDGLAVAGGTVFGIGRGGTNIHGHDVFRLRTSDGVFENWQGRDSASLGVPDLWQGRPDTATMPLHADGIEVHDGTLYLTFGDPSFSAEDVRSWKDFGAKLFEGGPVADQLLGLLGHRSNASGWSTSSSAGSPRSGPCRAIHATLRFCVAERAQRAAEVARRGARSRPPFRRPSGPGHAAFPGEIPSPRRWFGGDPISLAVCDARSGKLRKMIDVPLPTNIHAVSDRLVYVISGRHDRAGPRPARAARPRRSSRAWRTRSAWRSMRQAGSTSALGEPDHQVKVFTRRWPTGPHDRPQGRPPAVGALAGRRPVCHQRPSHRSAEPPVGHREPISIPSGSACGTWPTGKPLKEFFGSTHYGASGGAINPRDPNVLIGVGCEWRFDPKTQTHPLHGRFRPHVPRLCGLLHAGQRAALPGRQLRSGAQPQRRADLRTAGRRQLPPAGRDPPRLRRRNDHHLVRHQRRRRHATRRNGHRAGDLVTHGSNGWSMNLNPHDLTVFPVVHRRHDAGHVYRLPPAGFTACGAPRWDVAGMQELPYASGKDVNGRAALARRPAAGDLRRAELSTAVMRWPPAGCCGAIRIRSSRCTARTTPRRRSRGSRAARTASSARSPSADRHGVGDQRESRRVVPADGEGLFPGPHLRGRPDALAVARPGRSRRRHDPLPAGQRRRGFRRLADPGRRRQGLSPGGQDGRLERGTGQPGPGPRDRLRLGDPDSRRSKSLARAEFEKQSQTGRGDPRLRSARA